MRTNGYKALLAEARTRAKASRFATQESGSLTIFAIFIFVLILMISGMAVDIMRYETERATIQNTIDTAIVAAARLNQDADTNEEVTALVKEYVTKAGYDPAMITVTPDIQKAAGNTEELSRSVSARIDFNLDTMFMNMMGVDTLQGHTGGRAYEGQQQIEIALVLDISGSMGNNNKLTNLQTAARQFVTTVLANNGANRVSISIIPYNQQVYMDGELMSRLNLANQTKNVPGSTGANKPAGTITEYETRNPDAPCARFHAADFTTRRLASAPAIDVSASFVDDYFYWSLNGVQNTAYAQPNEFSFWCGSHHPTILLYQNDETTLHTFIDGLTAYGATAIDYGMNWAVGILDPSFEDVVEDMVDDNLLAESMRGHPVAYSNPDVMKYIVLMTDGQNTDHFDLKDKYKAGPSRVWFSETLANGKEEDGWLVEIPGNPNNTRWYQPRSPNGSGDDKYIAVSAFPADAQQWDFHQLYRRFRSNDVANYFFKYSDTAAHAEYLDVVADVGGYGAADTNLKAICDEANKDNGVEVFTVAFEAPANGEAVLQYCASKPGNYFKASGTQISTAFGSIAAQISQLRITN